MSKISLQMYTMRDFTKDMQGLENTIDKLREIGFRKLQYSVPEGFDSKEVKKIFDKNGIANDSVYCKCMSLEESAKKVLEDCELFNTNYIRTNSIPSGLSSNAAGYKMFAHYLNETSADYKKHGKKVLYHFHAFEFIRFGDVTGIDILLQETDPEAIQIIPDTHWVHSGGKSIVGFFEKYKDRYDYVHLKDFAIGTQGAKVEDRPILFAPVGEGNLEWGDVLALCKKNNVSSYAIEQDNCYGRDPFDCVASSFRFLKKMGVDN